MADERYNVVFEYTEVAGGYRGVRTITAWSTKEDFKKAWESSPEMQKTNKILAEGVSDQVAQELVSLTPLQCDINACIHEATNPETGEIDEFTLEMMLANVAFARGFVGRNLY